jgi:antitoxin component YwqK of YwqJK toxin-antitoxin module
MSSILSESGQIKQHEFYFDGELEGEYKYWHENGVLKQQECYKDGKLEGKYKRWYKNGQLRVQTLFRRGKMHGTYKSWYEDGQLREQVFHENGITQGETKFWSIFLNETATLTGHGHKYSINGRWLEFSRKRKSAFLNIKRRLYSHRRLPAISVIDSYFIPDLSKMICEF